MYINVPQNVKRIAHVIPWTTKDAYHNKGQGGDCSTYPLWLISLLCRGCNNPPHALSMYRLSKTHFLTGKLEFVEK